MPIDCWYSVKPIPEQTAAMIQKRSMILVSDQAIISKWWCSGAISRTRRRKVLKAKTWSGDRERLDHEDAADDDQQHLGLGHHREGADRAAEPERAGVPHEDRGREGVEPEEADAGADQAGGEQRQVLLLVGDEGDRRVGEEDDRAGAGGEAVEAVGEVDPVGGAGDDEEDEDEVEDRAEVDAGVADAEVERRLEADLVAGDPPEAEREDELEEQLPARREAERAALDDLDEVVGEAERRRSPIATPKTARLCASRSERTR